MVEEGEPPAAPAQDGNNSVISGIHAKLRNYKFDKTEDVYEYMLNKQAPKEATVISTPLSKSSLETLKCVAILFSWDRKEKTKAEKDVPVDFSPVFVKLLSRLLYGVQGKRYERRAKSLLRSILVQFDLSSLLKLTKSLFDLDKNMVCLSMVYNWMLVEGTVGDKKWGKADVFNEAAGGKGLAAVAELYTKEFLMTKVPKTPWVQGKVASNLLPHIRGSDGANVVISSISKALLRSPETAIEAVGYALRDMKPVLTDDVAKELAKKIGPCLGTDNEKLRQQANYTSQALFNLPSPNSTILEIFNEYFELVSPTAKGTKSALTSGAKIIVLNLIKSLADPHIGYSVTQDDGKRKQFANLVVEKCMKVLETDVHEGTLLECLEVIAAWSDGLGSECPAALLKYVKNGLTSLKYPLRLGLCRMMVQLINGSRIKVLPELVDSISKCIEKALAQPAVANNLTEAVSLSVVLINGSPKKEAIPDSVLGQMTKMPGYVDEKFLSTCSPWVHGHVALLVDFLLTNEVGTNYSSYYPAVVQCLCCPDRKVRQDVKQTMSEILRKNNNVRHAREFLKAIHGVVKKEDVSDRLKHEMITHYAQCVSGNLEKKDIVETAVELLVPCHEFENKNLWCLCVKKKLKIATNDLYDYNHDGQIFETYVQQFDCTPTKRRILRTLLKVYGDRIMGDAVEEAVKLLSEPGFSKISRDDYFIFRTPEGQLYNTAVADAGGDNGRNMKRESKVYSYKEQLEEIQLRKELEEKRKKSGKGPNYNAKQLEAIKVQLAKESAVRAQVAELDAKINVAIGILRESMNADLEYFECYVKSLVEELVSVMKSPVAAPPSVALFIQMGKTLFPSKWFGEAVAQCVLRLINPLCDLSKDWQAIKLQTTVGKILEHLKKFSQTSALSNAALSYCYPFFVLALRDFPRDSNVLTSIVQIIANFSSSVLSSFECDADTIPRARITSLLYQILETNDGTTQQLAVSTLISFCKTTRMGTEIVFLEPSELRRHLDALKSTVELSRDTSLTCLYFLCQNDWMAEEEELLQLLSASVYRQQFDPVARVADLGKKVWARANLPEEYELYNILKDDVHHPCEAVRVSASKAIGSLLSNHKSNLQKVLVDLRTNYEEYEVLTAPVVDSFGRILEEAVDNWQARCGIGLALKELAPLMSTEQAEENMKWIVTQTLGDRSNAVHVIMLEAAMEIVQIHGSSCLNSFIEIIETFLEKAEKTRRFDNVRQACVVLMGSLAKHMDPKDKRVKSIFDTLLETLATPSEKVQEAVANCLPALVPAVKDDAEGIIQKLTTKMMGAENFGDRRGAAYGLAGLIKGLGILSLKQHDIMNMLANGMQDKKDFKRREGSLMALELLCEFLGRLFEPYIVHVLPYLLQCLGDSNVYVREATENTAKRVMSRLSGHGVKLVLPALLAALNEDSWRTKCGSVELLGRMAYCAPRQLSGCLPMIVPKLIEVLGDSHVKVQDAAAKALGLIGSVIQNPEVASVVPVLLEALQDPGKRASNCLHALLQTEFVHFVDPPSLALIMPVVQRAFQDRSTENRKMACQIIGNMYSLTDHSDLAPYMDSVMPGIKASLLDPVPEVRAVAAKALGAMAKGMGEKCYEELLPWLMKTLVSDVNSVDRSGAAQGLAEVIGALGEENLHKFMPEIIRKADTDDLAPHVRDGYMMMFIYMPGVFEEAFVKYIGLIINPILKALADENEYVRETALRAGQRIVTGFADSAITLLLPELEKGVFDDNWRIRYSSVQLLGDLLYKISGVSGKMSTESANDDDNFGTEQSQKLIIAALGLERRNRVLAGLYMGRSDVALMVRQASLHVWKVIVANTPKTLREILPTLFSLLLGCLAAASHDKRQVAARTLGDLVRKLGEKILPEIIPILEKGLESQRSDERQGVCIGLCEIMANTSREMILAFVDNLVPTLRKALCDPQPEVRQAAAQTFGSLHSNVGSRALEEIVPFLMKKLNEGNQAEADQALDGLGQILIVKSKSVMPYLIPQLTAKPPNTRAMAILASVANDAMSKHLGKILPCLLEVLIDTAGLPQEKEELENCNRIILTVTDDVAVRLLIDDLLDNTKSENQQLKRSAVTLLSVFCVHSKADLSAYVAQLLRGLISLMTETDDVILNLVADAVAAVIKNLDSAEKLSYVADLRQAIMFAHSDLKGMSCLPGLCLPKKGINPMLPIYREAVLNGSAEMKEQATVGMGELITLSSEEALKPSVIHITGPLIRILGDRYGPSLKCAVLDTLTLLLVKVGTHLKAFLPQLQTTFLKSSNDVNRNVRLKAATGLAQLLPIHNKPDPMFLDVVNSLKNADDISVRDTLIYTLRCTIATGGHKISEATRRSVLAATNPHLSSSDESTYCVAAGTTGVLLEHLPEPDFVAGMNLLLSDDKDVTTRVARTSALTVGLKVSPARVYADETYNERVMQTVLNIIASDKPHLVSNGIRSCNHNDLPVPAALIQPFVKTINNSSNEVKALLGQASEFLGRRIVPSVVPRELARYLIPALVNGTKEKNSIVRASCETALIWILRLREGDNAMNTCLEYLDSGAREALNDVINKVLRKTLKEPESKEPDIDDTILT
ncbi:Translational activator GCN1 [Orchesella cincta]|uniref:Translational activator GCN1 n=1 Tax=Orchesella cincta TaxID=48709 RepID=A0A1D2NIW5_ORCCI|nr:Translational activator GCN1 [Orchesella cincta]